MCLVGTKERKRTAKEDIPVWKLVTDKWKLLTYDDNYFYSPYRNFKYEKGNEYHEPRMKPEKKISKTTTLFDLVVQDKLCGLGFDFHGRDTDEIPEGFMVITYGFHSFMELDRAKEAIGLTSFVVEMVIPKGSKYYTDDTGLIVSDRIIFKDH